MIRLSDLASTRLLLLAIAGSTLLALAGCSLAPSASSTTRGAQPSASDPGSSASLAAKAGASAGAPATTGPLCSTVSAARVNTLTGMDYSHADALQTGALQGSGCVYYDGATPGDLGHELDADVAWGGALSAAYDSARQELTGVEPITDIPGLGHRAFSTKDEVTVDYGDLVITVNDSAQIVDPLDVDQIRFVVDEIHRVYGG